MGGYAAILLASKVSNAFVVAECPQIFLEKHPGSRTVINSTGVDDQELINLSTIVKEKLIARCLMIICNSSDFHFLNHILPIMTFKSNVTPINYIIYSSSKYKNGHTSLDFTDAFKIIKSFLE